MVQPAGAGRTLDKVDVLAALDVTDLVLLMGVAGVGLADALRQLLGQLLRGGRLMRREDIELRVGACGGCHGIHGIAFQRIGDLVLVRTGRSRRTVDTGIRRTSDRQAVRAEL